MNSTSAATPSGFQLSVQPKLHSGLMRWLLAVGLASLALRLWIAVVSPITGDEAFFYWWGVYKDWGYYDHPPMVGWLIGLMRDVFGDALWAIRLPSVLLPLALGAGLGWALQPVAGQRAGWAVLFFWLAPINWLNVLITTDTPLIFWSMLSVAVMLRAELRPRLDAAARGLYALSDVFLGCAFLSKYFSVVLGLTYLVY
ncbi:MAG: glycosyltransferase family 39 protein, partial [Polaromonas sp.]